MKKKVWILGNQGMLGHIVDKWFNTMPEKYEVRGMNREHFNATNYGTDIIEDIEQNDKPDYIINCVGILNQGTRKDNIDDYADVNIVFPRVLSRYCQKNKIKFIHVSTNCVFDNIGFHFPDTAQPDATDIYGFSKQLGEITGPYTDNMTIRCSIIGTELRAFGTGMINQFISNPSFTTGFANAMYNGVTTLELAKWLEKNLERKGLVHYYTRELENKYDILCYVKEIWNIDKKLEKGVGTIHTALLAGDDFTTKTFYEQLKELKDFNEV